MKDDNTAAAEVKIAEIESNQASSQSNTIDAAYEKVLDMLPAPDEQIYVGRDQKTKKEDYIKSFRTHLVLFWVLSNGSLIAVLTSSRFNDWAQRFNPEKESGFNPYLIFVFWSVTVLSFIRFSGCILYLVFRGLGNWWHNFSKLFGSSRRREEEWVF